MELQNQFLSTYLEYVEETESPRIFHIWAALAAVGACLGRRVYLPFGSGQIFANNYILLVGPPGVRKSTAINTASRIVRLASPVRFAPDDTGGARQGLIAALRGELNASEDSKDDILELLRNELIDNVGIDDVGKLELNVADAHVLWVCASEFATFIGINALDMITFLTKMWDGEDYAYKIKAEFTTLHNPLLNILGGCTPAVISQALPPSAIGGGFMSRNILVYAAQKYKHIAFPRDPDVQLRDHLVENLRRVARELNGAFTFSGEAKAACYELYKYKVDISDPRFVYYMERRFTHLLKTAMCFCASRGSQTIGSLDVQSAQALLSYTEKGMVDALGEYGLSPIAMAKQKMFEYIQHSAPTPVIETILFAVMKRDMKIIDIRNSLMDLCNARKIHEVVTDYGKAYVYMGNRAKGKPDEAETEIVNMLKKGEQKNDAVA